MAARPRRRPTLWTTVCGGVLAAFACHPGYTARFGPERDAAAMAAILSTWTQTAGGTLVLSLCEDVTTAEAWTGPDCLVDHVVRAGGLGLAHEVHHTGGCGAGGCPFAATAYVRGTVQGDDFSGPVSVRGEVVLNDPASDPYAFPYRLSLVCDDPQQRCGIDGTLAADGRLDLEYYLGDPAVYHSTRIQSALSRAGPSTCP
jgi:hypothetical protein